MFISLVLFFTFFDNQFQVLHQIYIYIYISLSLSKWVISVMIPLGQIKKPEIEVIICAAESPPL